MVDVLFRNDPKYLDRQALANSVDPDQMSRMRCLYCLLHIQQYFRNINR